MKSGNYIIGLHIGHDATSTLIDHEGNIVCSMAEERITRIKYHMGFPYDGIEEVLKTAGVDKESVIAVVGSTRRQVFPSTPDYNELFFTRDKKKIRNTDFFNNPNIKSKFAILSELLVKQFKGDTGADVSQFQADAESFTKSELKKALNSVGLGHAEIFTYDHHRCHAASSFYYSGKKEALMITMDGAGDGLCASANVIEDNKVTCVSGAPDAVSPGRFYSEITGFVGFKRLRHEGKITGLAAYGDPEKFYDQLRNFIRFNHKTESFEYDAPDSSKMKQKLKTLGRVMSGRSASLPHIADFFDYLQANFDPEADMRDLAAAAQRILEEIAVEYVKHFLKKYPSKNVLLSGGVFANVRVNQFIAEIPGVEFIYIHQNMGDGGLAAGGAAIHLFETIGVKNPLHQPLDVYYGSSYDDDTIEGAIKESGIPYERYDNVEKKIAELLHDGKVVGRFNGGMEYGPRALGNRSILARTTDRSINDWLNKKLNRTEFMPFAPSIFGPRASDVLLDYEKGVASYADRFMTITYHVKPEWHDRLQAVTHVDGTARPQVVWEEGNPSYFKILENYNELSGIPAIINTSFNMHEEPIVRTPQEAIKSYNQGCIDFLAIGSFIVG